MNRARTVSTSPRRVLVTGSSRGIGKAIALELGAAGFQVTVHCRTNRDQAEQVVAELKSKNALTSPVLQCDVGDRAGCREALAKDLAEHGAFYGVVCNAGLTHDGPFPGLTDEDWDSVLRVNLDSFYNVLHPLIMPMIQQRCGGRVVTLSSLSGITGNRGQVNYSAAKAGVIGATKALSQELAKRGITVNCVAPGFIDTDMTAHSQSMLGANTQALAALVERIPMRRTGTVDEVAAAVGFLFSDRASYITGQVLSVNGGLL